MAIHYPTPPLGGGERPCLPSAQVGPVTQAIRAMRLGNFPTLASEGEGSSPTFVHGIRALSRPEIEDLIGDLIDLLDAMDGDPDAEPSLGAPEPIIPVGYGQIRCAATDQANWADGAADDSEQDAGDDREEENEHGGDIQDEPHDPQPDDVLPWMHGWDPQVADGARAARRQAEAMRARRDRRAHA